jgi:hypothetical protein
LNLTLRSITKIERCNHCCHHSTELGDLVPYRSFCGLR